MIVESSRLVAILASASPAAEQWVQLLPMGSFKGRDGRGPWTVADRAELEAVLAATLDRMSDMDLVVDYDHQTDLAAKAGVGGTAPAAGWITDVDARADGIWGLVQWTAAAAQKLAAREYRYLSPVFQAEPKTGRVKCIMRAGLTNNPNLSLNAVANSQMDDEKHLAELRSLLKLDEAADMAAVVEAVRAMAEATEINAADPTRFVPIEALEKVTAELNAAKANRSSPETAELVVNAAVESGKVPPALRSWAIELCAADRSAYDGFVTRTAPLLRHITTTNAYGVPPSSKGDSGGVAAEVAANLGLTPKQMGL